MRIVAFALALAVLGTFMVAMTPSASAAAICVRKVKEPIPSDKCDGIVCVGYNSQTGWQNCVPPEIYCLYVTDCCQYGTASQFYCPEPR